MPKCSTTLWPSQVPGHEKTRATNLCPTKKIPSQVSRSRWDHLRQLITIKMPCREMLTEILLEKTSEVLLLSPSPHQLGSSAKFPFHWNLQQVMLLYF